MQFCSWENPHFSSTVLSELLWQVAYSYTYELKPYLDLLLQMLLLEDSWQNHRIHNALKGIPDDRDGLFDTIDRSKNHYQKRAYQCIKMMVSLFSQYVSRFFSLHSFLSGVYKNISMLCYVRDCSIFFLVSLSLISLLQLRSSFHHAADIK
jgi:hypothetical protein